MIRAFFLLLAVTASLAAAERSNDQRVWFPDGTGVEVFSEATGSTQVSAPMAVTGIANDEVNRLILDQSRDVLFGYLLTAFRDTQSDTYVIRILPLDSKTLAILNDSHSNINPRRGPIPTVSMAREFRSLNVGEAVTLDVLYNPATGEKVYDVLRPIAGPSPYPATTAVTGVRGPARLSLKDIVLRVDGLAVSAPASWMIGEVVRIDIPGHGGYIIAANEPKEPGYTFYPSVRAAGKSLKWSIDGDQIEVTSQTNMGVDGIIWVYHQPAPAPQEQPSIVRLQSADKVEWLLPKKTERGGQ